MPLRKKKSLLDQAADYVDSVRPQVESAVAHAVDAIEEFYEGTARPALLDARDKAGPALADARDKAAPYVADALDRATDVATQAKGAADARVAQLRGEEPAKKKGSKLKKIALFAIVAGAVGFVAKKLQGGGESDSWQSSYVPTPAPTVVPEPEAVTDDAGGSAPDEAWSDAADAAEDAHDVSTPDEPVEVVELDTDAAPKKK
jgi:hypothetical protein